MRKIVDERPAFLDAIERWAAARSDVAGAALVGSYARGTARPQSDVDLVLLCSDPERFLAGDWISHFGEVDTFAMENYGALNSLRVLYRSGLEVEFGIASRSWASTPIDPGTRRVLTDGFRILYDPEQIFRAAKDAIARDGATARE
jgi:predicted nucleotidyltransferase